MCLDEKGCVKREELHGITDKAQKPQSCPYNLTE